LAATAAWRRWRKACLKARIAGRSISIIKRARIVRGRFNLTLGLSVGQAVASRKPARNVRDRWSYAITYPGHGHPQRATRSGHFTLASKPL
jgi:hypothetical protein